MNPYFQTSKQAAWALLFVTPLLALVVFLALGFVSVALGLIQLFKGQGISWHFVPPLVVAVVVPLSAWWLTRFYFVVAVKTPAPRSAQMGWALSACYYAALTWLFTFLMPGTVQITGDIAIKIPLALLSAASLGVSIYLLVRHPRRSAVQDVA